MRKPSWVIFPYSLSVFFILGLIVAVFSSCTMKKEHLDLDYLKKLEKKEGWKIVTADSNYLYSFSISERKEKPIFPKRAKEWFSSTAEREGTVANPSFSPDGQKIVFCRQPAKAGDNTIVIIGADGNNPQELISMPQASGTSWSPGGKKIAFLANYRKEDESKSLYTIDINTGSVTLIIEGGVHRLFSPSWSPDARMLIYQSVKNEVMVVNTESKAIKKLVDGEIPSWSTDGQRIAYKDREGKFYAINPEGSNRQFLFDGGITFAQRNWAGPGEVINPLVWSPDGKYFLFARTTGLKGSDSTIFIMGVESKKSVKIATISSWMYSWCSQKTLVKE